ncbi:hypothetical protein B0A61_07580 [Flavobacterium aquatile LMG 4008 = ATCC 11947]|uniref:Uncharacterized protein n=2 Tax=Flavobacterium aquatile TaxID=245 RepID=A0A095UYZ8_9FLAO|nr:hypothetical protein LG45_11845 [Flavobacterium aquatile LMG 4008 = ATCC 11947]OXA67664.1 hypothetical protein B0A61_07580 [Flavobacterium aquatile LMG 4008 = ATCC 11947]GEC78302.1 hypothetical protein FAQ01_11720 [Flavobacterium aquatile]
MEQIENPSFSDYDELVYEATTYIFSNPVNSKSEEFLYAVKIAQFWMNRDTEFGMPIFGVFHTKLTKENNQKFFYVIAMMHYNLIQKIEKNRVIKFVKVEGVKFSDLPEVQEVQYEGAKILLNYAKQKDNNFPLNSDMQVYIEANENGTLKEVLFK